MPAGQATLDDGAEAWKMMRESGIAPNCRTYSAMLTFFANFAVAERTRSHTISRSLLAIYQVYSAMLTFFANFAVAERTRSHTK